MSRENVGELELCPLPFPFWARGPKQLMGMRRPWRENQGTQSRRRCRRRDPKRRPSQAGLQLMSLKGELFSLSQHSRGRAESRDSMADMQETVFWDFRRNQATPVTDSSHVADHSESHTGLSLLSPSPPHLS